MSEVISLEGTDAQREAAIVEAVRSCIARLKAGSGGEGATWYRLPSGLDREENAACMLRDAHWSLANQIAGNLIVPHIGRAIGGRPLAQRFRLDSAVVEAACRHPKIHAVAQLIDEGSESEHYLIRLDQRAARGVPIADYVVIETE